MSFDLAESLAVLERTPATSRALLDGLPDAWIQADEGPGTCSPFDNLGHPIHGERTDWIARATLILAQGSHRTFEPYDRFAQRRESAGKSLATLRQLLATWVAHDLGHLAQTARVMAKRHREAAGPWRAYLPILDR